MKILSQKNHIETKARQDNFWNS